MALTKPAGGLTYQDLLSLPNDGRRFEIIEGELYEMPSPSWDHATTIMNLIALLLPVVSALQATLRTAPLDVFFPGADPVQPDLVVLLPDGSADPSRRGLEGSPDLIIEILSPSNRSHAHRRDPHARSRRVPSRPARHGRRGACLPAPRQRRLPARGDLRRSWRARVLDRHVFQLQPDQAHQA